MDYTNKSHRFRGAITHFALLVRRRFYNEFIRLLSPNEEDSILDVGVTPDVESEDTNFLERWYPLPSHITATSIEDASILEAQYPGLKFVQTGSDPLPFDDGQFNISFSSAVVEHIGSRERQRAFVHEQVRVSDRFFITTPNRWSPIEIHTFIPLIHWLPQPVHQTLLRWCGQNEWAKTENLNLLSRRNFRNLFPADCEVSISAIRTFGFNLNLFAYGRSSPAPNR